jgi:hypothetical protein
MTSAPAELLGTAAALRAGIANTVIMKSILDDEWFNAVEQTIDSGHHRTRFLPTQQGFCTIFVTRFTALNGSSATRRSPCLVE